MKTKQAYRTASTEGFGADPHEHVITNNDYEIPYRE